MDRKRTKAVEKMVDEANRFLLANRVKNRYDSELFNFISSYLLSLRMYKGYNFYNILKEANGEIRLVLSGSATNYDVVQFY